MSLWHKQHINILETKMIQGELKDLVSKTRNLSVVCRQSLGWSIVRRKTLHLVWIRSECNPADYPSRCRRIPQPNEIPSDTSVAAFGDSLDSYRKRRSNRDIWRQVLQVPRRNLLGQLGLLHRHGILVDSWSKSQLQLAPEWPAASTAAEKNPKHPPLSPL